LKMSPQKVKARGQCMHITGPPWRYHVIASDAVWNATSSIPGNLVNPVQVVAGTHAPQYRPRPDYDPPAAIDEAATAVELSGKRKWIWSGALSVFKLGPVKDACFF
jgi:hypothetical protein